uniref:Uncharacterized protein n=1 Tax=Arundo donax TaxID=35708 RepID=A0A0A9CHU8_ARUDO
MTLHLAQPVVPSICLGNHRRPRSGGKRRRWPRPSPLSISLVALSLEFAEACHSAMAAAAHGRVHFNSGDPSVTAPVRV